MLWRQPSTQDILSMALDIYYCDKCYMPLLWRHVPSSLSPYRYQLRVVKRYREGVQMCRCLNTEKKTQTAWQTTPTNIFTVQ